MRLYYIGTVVLGMTQADFWRTTFRKLRALTLCHLEQRGGKRARMAMPFDDLT